MYKLKERKEKEITIDELVEKFPKNNWVVIYKFENIIYRLQRIEYDISNSNRYAFIRSNGYMWFNGNAKIKNLLHDPIFNKENIFIFENEKEYCEWYLKDVE